MGGGIPPMGGGGLEDIQTESNTNVTQSNIHSVIINVMFNSFLLS